MFFNKSVNSLAGLLLVLLFAFVGCIEVPNNYSGIPPGVWRASLLLDAEQARLGQQSREAEEALGKPFDEVTAGELPFTFEVSYLTDDSLLLEIINGEERIPVRDVQIFHTKRNSDDSIRIEFPIYDSHITARYEGGIMQGKWIVRSKKNYAIPFEARYGQNHRFTVLKKKPFMDVSGRWEATFEEEEDAYPAIAEFQQNGNELTGTFLTETGDYRYLAGTIQDQKIYLSTFDGSHAFLFEAKIMEDSTLVGSFRSGKHYETIWTARRNPDARLTDPDSLTFLKEGFDELAFSFENPDGKVISLDNPEYQDKIKLVQIFGTWCPNCRDETAFLNDYLREKGSDDLAVIALAFERSTDPAKGREVIQRYKDEFGIDYEIVLAGPNRKSEAAKALPMLNHVLSYPTLIFVDRENKVRRIHTGFNGPATSAYADFTEEFDQYVQQLIAEESLSNN